MNYLAHIQLSGSNMQVAVGNFIGDGVKGRIKDIYTREVSIGIHLHRFIDHTTDSDLINAKARKDLYPTFGKYAGIFQDMVHDHFLARNWHRFESRTMKLYLEEFYQASDEHIDIFPSHQRRFLAGIRAGDWLVNYKDVEGMQRSFVGLSKRIGRVNPLALGGGYLEANAAELESQFLEFYPTLQKAADEELARLLKTH